MDLLDFRALGTLLEQPLVGCGSNKMTLFLLASFALVNQTSAPTQSRERVCIDKDWRFAFGNANDPKKDFDPSPAGTVFSYFAKAGVAQGAAAVKFADSQWRKLDLPHDWAVELPFDNGGTNSHGSKALGRNFPQNSVGWYRKTFDVPATDKGRRIGIDFDGVFRDSQVWVNGFYLGRESSGYKSFSYDMSDYLNYGGANTVAVRVDASLEEGWFYEGAGIYRHVWLTKTAPLHVAKWGTYVTTEVKGKSARVTDRVTVQNDADADAKFVVEQAVVAPDGHQVSAAKSKTFELGPGAKAEYPFSLAVADAQLWSPETPTLYSVQTTITQNGKPVDSYKTSFGIRTIKWDANKGFFMNGKHIFLKGVCDHQDHAGVGVAVPDGLNVWRLKQLKKMGVNALRTSHNAPDPTLLDACDRLGILVMDENRETGINPQEFDGLKMLITRDRNHPSVVIWSIGNEEWSIEGNDRGARVTARMQAYAKSLDPTRLTTVAISGGWGVGSSTTIDLMGFNYFTHGNGRDTGTDKFHEQFPNKPSVATEDASTLSTRGIYVTDNSAGHLSAYDVNAPSWATNAQDSVQHYASRAYVGGQFQWTGFDYRGEPTPYGWPSISSQFGILDLCGFPKDNFYYYKAWWGDKPVVHLFPHWNWAGQEGKPIDVWVHSNCQEVELFLNGTSLGRKPVPHLGHVEWKVPYAPGTLIATGYSGGKVVLTDKVETTGDSSALALSEDVESDISIIAVSAKDANGRAVATAALPVTFTLTGPGRILGVGNGDPASHEADQAVDGVWQRKLFGGLAQVIVQATGPGEIVLTAHSPGVADAVLHIAASPTAPKLLRP